MFIYKGTDAESPTTTRPAKGGWHAVTVVGTPRACAAAQACKGARYLSREAPRLPLAGCDADCCDCRYAHFDDRRRGPRRADEKTGASTKRVEVDHRARPGRRSTDHGID